MIMVDEQPPRINTAPSDRRLLVQAKFDLQGVGPLSEWIAARREERMAWVHISNAIHALTGMEVSYETLRRWAAQDEAASADTD